MTQERSREQKRVDGLEAELGLLKLKHQSLAKEIRAIEDRMGLIDHPTKGELAAARSALKLEKWRDQINKLPPAIWTNFHEPKGGVCKVTHKQVHIAIAASPGRIDRIAKDSGRLNLKAMGIEP